jgi:outer membrane immunogenic protein
MKRFLIALLSLGALGTAPVFAQPISGSDWSGLYLGAQFGYEIANTNSVTTNLVGTFPVPFDYTSDGVVGGGHAGYNFQFGRFVLGVEGDAEAAALAGQQAVNAYGVTYVSRTTSDFDASIRARGGFAFNQFLIYGTGGVAWGQVKIAYSCAGCVSAAGANSTLDDVRTGWTAGAGAAYRLTRNVSLNLEYRHTDLGSKRLIDPVEVADYHQNSFTSDAMRLGVSLHFLP